MIEQDLLRIENLHVQFPGPSRVGDVLAGRQSRVRAVNDVSLSLRRGETLGIVGETGCGKTTLGRCIVKLVEPTSGRIAFQGADVTRLRGAPLASYRRRVQMVFQDPHASLNPKLTVGQTLAEVLRVHAICGKGEVQARVVSLLKQVGLPATFANRRSSQMSGGQCQRIGIARALALQPDLLVCDEAVSALDVSVQAQILNLLQETQQARGLALIFISHDLSVVRHLCRSVGVMYLGKLVEMGPAEDILGQPLHPYTRALVAAVPRRNAAVMSALNGEPPSPLSLPSGCHFHPRCSHVLPICRAEPPPAMRQSGTVGVACHLYPEATATAPAQVLYSEALHQGR